MPHDKPVLPVTTADGHRFDLIDVAADSPRATMLFLPGMGLSARNYIRFAETLAERGIRVFIHEWRGIGSSDQRASREATWGYRELLADIDAARRAVHKLTGRAHLLGGHSLGSQFACLSAARSPNNCRGLVLVAGGSPYWRVFPMPMKLVMIATMFAFPLMGSLFGYYPGKRIGFAGSEARGVMADWARTARRGEYRPTGVEVDLEAGMARLKLPVLTVDMADDWFVPPQSIEWLTGKLTGCQLTERAVKADHMNHKADHYAWMKHPEATARAIDEWV